MRDTTNQPWRIDAGRCLEALKHLVERDCGQVSELTPLPAWGPTVVAVARLADGRQVVVKCSGRQDVEAEAAAARLAGEVSVPAPAVLATGTDARLPGRRWFLMSFIEGTPWSSLPPGRPRDIDISGQIGELFARLHAVTRPGFGPLTRDGAGTATAWRDWLAMSMSSDIEHLRSAGVSAAERLAATEALEVLAGPLAQRPGVLIHGDLGDSEVFVDPGTGRVTGLADWGSALIADPLYEFARFVAGGPPGDDRPERFLPPLLARYRSRTGVDIDRSSPLLLLYEAHNALANAVWAQREGLDWSGELCRRAAGLLDRAAAG